MESAPSFENAAMKDTFNDLYRTIEPLIAEKKYDEAKKEVKKELRLLAGALGGSLDKQLAMVNEEFEAFLPEYARALLKDESSREVSPEKDDQKNETVSAESDNEVIEQMEKEGWELKDIITDTYTVNADDVSGKEIKIVNCGKRQLVFLRKKNDLHGSYDYE